MKTRPFLLIIIFFFCGNFYQSQKTVHTLISTGYTYQNQSFGEIGGKLLFLDNDDFLFRLGASGLLGSVNNEFTIIPKIQGDILFNTEKNVDFYHSYYFLAGTEVTTKYVAPKAGLSLFGIVDLTAGYAFPIDKVHGKKLKGLHFNFTLNIPTVFIHDLFN